MKNRRWIASFTLVASALLFANGAMSAWVLEAARSVEAGGIGPYSTPDDVARVRSMLPWLYLVTAQGLGLGLVAFAGALGLFVQRPWALRLLFTGSIVLMGCSIVAVAMAPRSWDIQAIFLMFGAMFLWEARKQREPVASAL